MKVLAGGFYVESEPVSEAEEATDQGFMRRRIVEEAREIRARALVMSLPPRRAGTSLFGKTLETILAERPCRVIIESSRGLDDR